MALGLILFVLKAKSENALIFDTNSYSSVWGQCLFLGQCVGAGLGTGIIAVPVLGKGERSVPVGVRDGVTAAPQQWQEA